MKKHFKLNANEKKILRKTAFNHLDPYVQRKCYAILFMSFLLSASLVGLILGLTPTTIRNYWKKYKTGGIEALKKTENQNNKSALTPYANSIEREFNERPPSSIVEATARIEEMTGVKRSLKTVRLFLKKMKFRYRKVAGIPSKADPDKQKEFLENTLEPLLEQAKKGLKVVLFMDAAHFVHGAFLGCLWSINRIFIKTPSGRRRFNVLGAVNAISKQLHTVCNDTYINASCICDLLKQISVFYCNIPISIILDNAAYQKCDLVTKLAIDLKIELIYLPTYSPNLNLIERLWKFIKKKSLNSKYYEKFESFRLAIQNSLEKCDAEWKKELAQLLSLNFQLFTSEKNDAA